MEKRIYRGQHLSHRRELNRIPAPLRRRRYEQAEQNRLFGRILRKEATAFGRELRRSLWILVRELTREVLKAVGLV